VAVIGVAHEKWGERPVALVVPRPGHQEAGLEEGIRAFLGRFVEAGNLSKWAVPDRIRVVAEIPKTSVGKINKKVIRQEVARDS
jgi:fatty-acyl-CoA synthase